MYWLNMSNKKLEIRNRRGKVISFTQFRAENERKLLTHAIARKQIVSSGILTPYKIKKLVKQKKLNKITSGGKIYFERIEVTNCISFSTTQQCLF